MAGAVPSQRHGMWVSQERCVNGPASGRGSLQTHGRSSPNARRTPHCGVLHVPESPLSPPRGCALIGGSVLATSRALAPLPSHASIPPSSSTQPSPLLRPGDVIRHRGARGEWGGEREGGGVQAGARQRRRQTSVSSRAHTRRTSRVRRVSGGDLHREAPLLRREPRTSYIYAN